MAAAQWCDPGTTRGPARRTRAEEKAGKVRWLRPTYQISRVGDNVPVAAAQFNLAAAVQAATKAKQPAWPTDVISQIGAVKRVLALAALTVEEVAAGFAGAKVEIVRRHVDILLVMGEVQRNPDGRYQGAG